VPEAELGFGDNTSLIVIANAVLPLDFLNAPVEPYVGVGVGLDTSDGLGLNLLGGAQYTLSNGLRVFGEYSTLDFFNVNRVLGGVRLQF
jgi:hypothetical protein